MELEHACGVMVMCEVKFCFVLFCFGFWKKFWLFLLKEEEKILGMKMTQSKAITRHSTQANVDLE